MQVNYYFVIALSLLVFVTLFWIAIRLEQFYIMNRYLSCGDFALICKGYRPSPELIFNKTKLISHLVEVLNCPIEHVSILFNINRWNSLNKKKMYLEYLLRQKTEKIRGNSDQAYFFLSSFLTQNSSLKESPAKEKMSGYSKSQKKSIQNLERRLLKAETKLEEYCDQIKKKSMEIYQGVFFITFNRQSDVSGTLSKMWRHKNSKIKYWILFLLSFGCYHYDSGLSKEIKEFFDKCQLSPSVDPKDVNWKYKRPKLLSKKRCLFGLVYLLVFGASPIAVYFLYEQYYKEYLKFYIDQKSILSLDYVRIYSWKLVIIVLELVDNILIGFAMHQIKSAFLYKSKVIQYSVLSFLSVQVFDYVLMYYVMVQVASDLETTLDNGDNFRNSLNPSEKKEQIYKFIINTVLGAGNIAFLLAQPILNKISFSFVSKRYQKWLLNAQKSAYTQLKANKVYQPITHDIPLSISYVGVIIMLKCIYSVFNPLIYLLILVISSMNYWIEKYSILRVHKHFVKLNYQVFIQVFAFFNGIGVVSLLVIYSAYWQHFMYEVPGEKHLNVHRPHSRLWIALITVLTFWPLWFWFRRHKINERVQKAIWDQIQAEEGQEPSMRNIFSGMEYQSLRMHLDEDFESTCPDETILAQSVWS